MSDTRCGAKTRTGKPCQQRPIAGAKRCRMHGGRTAKAGARAKLQKATRQILGEVPEDNVDPAQALLRLISMKWAEVLWLRMKVTQIPDGGADDQGLVWGRTSSESGVGPHGPIDKTDYSSEANIWWRLLREAEDQLARYSAAALKAGVEQRHIELQEAQAVHLASAINQILAALNLTEEQAQQVPVVVPQVLRSLPTEGARHG